MKKLLVSHKLTWIFVITTLAMVGILLTWLTDVRYRDFNEYQQRIMQSSANGTAGEIGMYMSELRRSVHLFADNEGELLHELATHPDDTRLHERLNQAVHTHFPDAFAFTIAERSGKPLLEDFDGLLGEVCVKDIQKFAADRPHSRVYIHPHPTAYHFDIMVDWERDGSSQGIFFVSFPADILSRILKHGQIPDHQLMLLNHDIPGLIEVTDVGARIKLNREFKLSPEETRRISYFTPIQGTSWDMADLPAPALFQNAYNRIRQEALLIMLVFVAVSAMMTGLLLRTQVKNRKLEHLYTHDPLTELPNRYLLIERLQKLILMAQREQLQFALFLIDLGNFKKPEGTFFEIQNNNSLLKLAGQRIQDMLPASATLARLSGNEFAVLLPDVSTEQASHIAEKVREGLNQSLIPGNPITLPHASIGIAGYPEHGKDFESLIQRANLAMHSAKRTGNNIEAQM